MLKQKPTNKQFSNIVKVIKKRFWKRKIVGIILFSFEENIFLAKRSQKKYHKTTPLETNQEEKGTDPRLIFKDANSQTTIEEDQDRGLKNIAEQIPTVPNEDVNKLVFS